jgi:hypothetical protein
MIATYNYIYDEKGVAEYVVLPVKIWNFLKPYLSTSNEIKLEEIKPAEKQQAENFNPKDYFGCISHLNLDIEQEIKNMRNEWDRNF